MEGLVLCRGLWTASAEARLVPKDLHVTGEQHKTSVHVGHQQQVQGLVHLMLYSKAPPAVTTSGATLLFAGGSFLVAAGASPASEQATLDPPKHQLHHKV